MVRAITRILDREHRDRLKRIRKLPKEENRRELADFLYDECFRQAKKFVQTELARKESPFHAVKKYRFFHEAMIIGFWTIDKALSARKKGFMNQVHESYFRSFDLAAEDAAVSGPPSIEEKYHTYHEYWDETTGHQDFFAEKALGYIFGKHVESPAASFSIITYADDLIRTFKEIKKTFRNEGITLKGEGDKTDQERARTAKRYNLKT